MGYEAQVAGLTDMNPYTNLLNYFKRIFKVVSVRDIVKRRKEVSDYFRDHNLPLEFFNGGGSGSISTTSIDSSVTEVTVGSGLLQSKLFDYYQSNLNMCSFCFALRVTRISDEGFVTCQSGGFIGSGEIGLDKEPIPFFLPKGIETIKGEGFGEVQTPLKITIPNTNIKIGDLIFVRPAKAGEIAEHFEEYVCIRNKGMKQNFKVRTYRGEGKKFY